MTNNEPNTSIALDSDFIDLDAFDRLVAEYEAGVCLLGEDASAEAYALRMLAAEHKAAEIIKAITLDPLAAMKKFNQWIVWREEPNPKGGKPLKVPKVRSGEYNANPHNKNIWMSYGDAKAAADRLGNRFGVGFVFTANTKLFFFDLDKCINPETGEISAEASELIAMFPGCMVERSVSGTGFHVVGTYEGDEPAHECKSEGWLELYTDKRFMALGKDEGRTGDVGVIATDWLNNLIALHFEPSADAIVADGTVVSAEWTTDYDPRWNGYEDIDEQLQKALDSQLSANQMFNSKLTFKELHNGSCEGYPLNADGSGSSEADGAYFFVLAFWFGGNCDVMESVALAGPRYRDKWITSRGDRTWLKNDILSAVAKHRRDGGDYYRKDYRSDALPELSADEHSALLQEDRSLDASDDKSPQGLDILRHVDDSHIWKRFSQYSAEVAIMPLNTTALITLGVFSSIACRAFAVKERRRRVPIGLYAVAEQPSGAGKSRVINMANAPFMDIHKRLKSEVKPGTILMRYNNGLSVSDSRGSAPHIDDLEARFKRRPFVSNTTPEALDNRLLASNGYFSAVSSEQTLIDSLLGLNGYKQTDKANNNEVLLAGFDAQDVDSERQSRDTFSGNPVGSIVCFAQRGLIEKVLKASQGTGVSERFLMLSEKHMLDAIIPDHEREDLELEAEYASKCEFFEDVLLHAPSYDNLRDLAISEDARLAIVDCRNRLAPHLKDGAKYSHESLRSAARKIDMQIMKIAACLQVLDDHTATTIADKYVHAGIGIAYDLLEANRELCIDKGIIGQRAEFEAVISYLSNKPHNRARLRDMINSLSRSHPFKDMTGNKSGAVKDTLNEMVRENLLSVSGDASAKKITYELN